MRKNIAPFLIGLLILPLILLTLALLGLLPVHATANPPRWEVAIAEHALEASLERRASGIKNPLVVFSDDILLDGMKLYINNCSGCHGAFQNPSPWGTKNFYPRVPQLAAEHSDLTAEEMFVVVKHGVRYSGMASWNGLIPESDMWRVVTFLSRVDALPPQVDAVWKDKR